MLWGIWLSLSYLSVYWYKIAERAIESNSYRYVVTKIIWPGDLRVPLPATTHTRTCWYCYWLTVTRSHTTLHRTTAHAHIRYICDAGSTGAGHMCVAKRVSAPERERAEP